MNGSGIRRQQRSAESYLQLTRDMLKLLCSFESARNTTIGSRNYSPKTPRDFFCSLSSMKTKLLADRCRSTS